MDKKYKDRLKKEDPKRFYAYKNDWRFGGTKNKDRVINKYQGKCYFCSKETSEIHHIDKQGRDKKVRNNNLENLILLCHSCHAKVHYITKKIIACVSDE